MNPIIKKIEELLTADGSEIAKTCDRILKQGQPVFMSIEIPLKNAKDIYLRRAELNASRGSPIKGFEELAKALTVETSPSVGIQSIEVDADRFSIFTTPDLSRVIGILLFPPNGSHRLHGSEIDSV